MARGQHRAAARQPPVAPTPALSEDDGNDATAQRHLPPVTDPAEPRERTLRLRILCTTDLHGHLWPFDYETDRPAAGRGLAGIATRIAAARRAAPCSLLVDCGDILQGTALADRAAAPGAARAAGARTRFAAGSARLADAAPESDAAHPMIRAMNAMAYDAAALGNHDFNYGLAPLQRALGAARFPVICANLVAGLGADPAQDTPLVPPWCIVTRRIADAGGQTHDLCIGLIATAPPQTPIWDAAVLRGGLEARDAVAAVAAHLPGLRAAGADIVVVLSHGGPGDPTPRDMAEDAGLAIAALPGVDAVLTGHSHRRLPGPDYDGQPGVDARAGRLAGKPAAMAGAFGSDLAVMDLDLVPRDDGGWHIARSRVTLRPTARTRPRRAILDLTRADHDATRAQMATPVGHTHTRLHAVLPMVTASPALALLAEAQAARAAEMVAGSTLDGLAILSAVAPFRAGGPAGPRGFVDIPEGLVRLRHMVQLSPFPNRLCVLALTGADLRAWLERSVSAYRTVRPGATDVPLMDPQAAAYRLDEIHGLRYTVDLSRPPCHGTAGDGPRAATQDTPGRITGMWHAGRPVAATDRFAVATNSYRANGGGGYAAIPRDTPRLFSRGSLRDILIDHLAARSPVTAPDGAPWRFVPLGASVIARTAPEVRCATHGDGATRMEDAGHDPEGYRRIRLFL